MQNMSGYRDVGVRGAVNSHIVEAWGCANLLHHGRKLRTVGAIAEEHNLPSFALVTDTWQRAAGLRRHTAGMAKGEHAQGRDLLSGLAFKFLKAQVVDERSRSH